jgi:hypothetical protein
LEGWQREWETATTLPLRFFGTSSSKQRIGAQPYPPSRIPPPDVLFLLLLLLLLLVLVLVLVVSSDISLQRNSTGMLFLELCTF